MKKRPEFFTIGEIAQAVGVTRRLVEYAEENGFTPLGTLRNVYLEGLPQHKDPSKFITQVVLPIEDTDGRR